MTDEERERGQAEFIEQYARWYKKMKYEPMLRIPAEPWNVDASWRDGYFRASKEIIQGVVDGRLMPAIHGVAGVFMFRHYMELAMKYTVFHARWLVSENKNAAWDDVKDLHRSHSLMGWWNSLKGETKRKIPKAEWDALDVEFVEECVKNFEAVDPDPGWRFRYHGKFFAVDKRPAHERAPVLNHLYIDFKAVFYQMDHVHDVLNAIDVYLVESHGQNAEWEAEMNSW
jgi:hypothetical protein